jgi:hypothetical protein
MLPYKNTFNMRNIIVLLTAITLIWGCQESKPSQPFPENAQTLDQITAFFDSIYSEDLVDTTGIVLPYTTTFPENYPSDEVPSHHTSHYPSSGASTGYPEWSSYDLELDTTEYPSKYTPDSLNAVLGVTEESDYSPTNEVNPYSQVLRATDLLFVWEGDTCTTDSLVPYLQQYVGNDLYCLGDSPENIKEHTVALMTTYLLMGDPTSGVEAADAYLRSILLGNGLCGYVMFLTDGN